jgi:hypothetical protein
MGTFDQSVTGEDAGRGVRAACGFLVWSSVGGNRKKAKRVLTQKEHRPPPFRRGPTFIGTYF